MRLAYAAQLRADLYSTTPGTSVKRAAATSSQLRKHCHGGHPSHDGGVCLSRCHPAWCCQQTRSSPTHWRARLCTAALGSSRFGVAPCTALAGRPASRPTRSLVLQQHVVVRGEPHARAQHILQRGSLPGQRIDHGRAVGDQGRLGEVRQQRGHRVHGPQIGLFVLLPSLHAFYEHPEQGGSRSSGCKAAASGRQPSWHMHPQGWRPVQCWAEAPPARRCPAAREGSSN